MPLTAHEVRYEALVRDFDAETQALCAFADVPWSDALRQFGATAQRRGVATASAGQVRKGLYDGSGQWRPYARYFEPVLPILQPWIERFGYCSLTEQRPRSLQRYPSRHRNLARPSPAP